MRKVLLGLMLALTVMLAPNLAYAEELDAGLEQREPISAEDYGNIPSLELGGLLGSDGDGGTRADPETPLTAAQLVQQPIDRMWHPNNNQNTVMDLIRIQMPYWITVPVALVFLWWGVRKAAQVLMSAFRKGKMNL